MSAPRLQKIRKRLTRAERFIADGVKALSGDDDAMRRMEARYGVDFVQPLREIVAIVRRGGITLPPQELARLVRLEALAAQAADRPTATQEAIREIAAESAGGTGTGTDRTAVARHDIDPALLAELLAGPVPELLNLPPAPPA